MENLGKHITNQRPYWLQFVFAGQAFTASYKFTLGATTTVNFQFKVEGRLVHGISRGIAIDAGGPVTFDILEAPTTITDGTTLFDCKVNMDRRSTKTSGSIFYTNPTNITGGTLIERVLIPTGGGPNTSIIFAGGELERIYKPTTNYVLRFANAGAQASTINYTFVWYETTN